MVTFPQHSSKHRLKSLVTAAQFHRYEKARRASRIPKVPRTIVMVFGSRWNRYLRRKYRGKRDPRSDVYRVTKAVGVVHLRGPGAPFAAIVVEELAALGARAFVLVGLAGSLQPDLRLGSIVLCDKALRDEGTSHHYTKAGRFARPSAELNKRLDRLLRRKGVDLRRGSSWTIDAPYRETVPEIRRYRRMGILTVEMESSAVFTVARHLQCQAAAILVVSDHLHERGWQPLFYESNPALRRAFTITVEGLAE
ncbi:MAG TPA: nucleoside phosphorylase [Thermoplasmata archaeon]|nr:nucleoside phosphorylase [Thermoplasmata archaeon]